MTKDPRGDLKKGMATGKGKTPTKPPPKSRGSKKPVEIELVHNHDADCPGCDATIARLTGENAELMRLLEEQRMKLPGRLEAELSELRERVEAAVAWAESNKSDYWPALNLLALLSPTPEATGHKENDNADS